MLEGFMTFWETEYQGGRAVQVPHSISVVAIPASSTMKRTYPTSRLAVMREYLDSYSDAALADTEEKPENTHTAVRRLSNQDHPLASKVAAADMVDQVNVELYAVSKPVVTQSVKDGVVRTFVPCLAGENVNVEVVTHTHLPLPVTMKTCSERENSTTKNNDSLTWIAATSISTAAINLVMWMAMFVGCYTSDAKNFTSIRPETVQGTKIGAAKIVAKALAIIHMATLPFAEAQSIQTAADFCAIDNFYQWAKYIEIIWLISVSLAALTMVIDAWALVGTVYYARNIRAVIETERFAKIMSQSDAGVALEHQRKAVASVRNASISLSIVSILVVLMATLAPVVTATDGCPEPTLSAMEKSTLLLCVSIMCMAVLASVFTEVVIRKVAYVMRHSAMVSANIAKMTSSDDVSVTLDFGGAPQAGSVREIQIRTPKEVENIAVRSIIMLKAIKKTQQATSALSAVALAIMIGMLIGSASAATTRSVGDIKFDTVSLSQKIEDSTCVFSLTGAETGWPEFNRKAYGWDTFALMMLFPPQYYDVHSPQMAVCSSASGLSSSFVIGEPTVYFQLKHGNTPITNSTVYKTSKVKVCNGKNGGFDGWDTTVTTNHTGTPTTWTATNVAPCNSDWNTTLFSPIDHDFFILGDEDNLPTIEVAAFKLSGTAVMSFDPLCAPQDNTADSIGNSLYRQVNLTYPGSYSEAKNEWLAYILQLKTQLKAMALCGKTITKAQAIATFNVTGRDESAAEIVTQAASQDLQVASIFPRSLSSNKNITFGLTDQQWHTDKRTVTFIFTPVPLVAGGTVDITGESNFLVPVSCIVTTQKYQKCSTEAYMIGVPFNVHVEYTSDGNIVEYDAPIVLLHWCEMPPSGFYYAPQWMVYWNCSSDWFLWLGIFAIFLAVCVIWWFCSSCFMTCAGCFGACFGMTWWLTRGGSKRFTQGLTYATEKMRATYIESTTTDADGKTTTTRTEVKNDYVQASPIDRDAPEGSLENPFTDEKKVKTSSGTKYYRNRNGGVMRYVNGIFIAMMVANASASSVIYGNWSYATNGLIASGYPQLFRKPDWDRSYCPVMPNAQVSTYKQVTDMLDATLDPNDPIWLTAAVSANTISAGAIGACTETPEGRVCTTSLTITDTMIPTNGTCTKSILKKIAGETVNVFEHTRCSLGTIRRLITNTEYVTGDVIYDTSVDMSCWFDPDVPCTTADAGPCVGPFDQYGSHGVVVNDWYTGPATGCFRIANRPFVTHWGARFVPDTMTAVIGATDGGKIHRFCERTRGMFMPLGCDDLSECPALTTILQNGVDSVYDFNTNGSVTCYTVYSYGEVTEFDDVLDNYPTNQMKTASSSIISKVVVAGSLEDTPFQLQTGNQLAWTWGKSGLNVNVFPQKYDTSGSFGMYQASCFDPLMRCGASHPSSPIEQLSCRGPKEPYGCNLQMLASGFLKSYSPVPLETVVGARATPIFNCSVVKQNGFDYPECDVSLILKGPSAVVITTTTTAMSFFQVFVDPCPVIIGHNITAANVNGIAPTTICLVVSNQCGSSQSDVEVTGATMTGPMTCNLYHKENSTCCFSVSLTKATTYIKVRLPGDPPSDPYYLNITADVAGAINPGEPWMFATTMDEEEYESMQPFSLWGMGAGLSIFVIVVIAFVGLAIVVALMRCLWVRYRVKKVEEAMIGKMK